MYIYMHTHMYAHMHVHRNIKAGTVHGGVNKNGTITERKKKKRLSWEQHRENTNSETR